ncbi:MAG: glycosyltransferase, partial [bacterium]
MNIIMITNTYLPHVGGVANSVHQFTTAYREQGHRVLVIAPSFRDATDNETDVVRIPAIQNFNGSDFSVILPIPALLNEPLKKFKPDIVHSHHPFLLGDTAVRIASAKNLPLVFTYHTQYDQYTHYAPIDSPLLRDFIIELSTNYANLCDQVIAPSASIRSLLEKRGVTSPIEVIPTGVDVGRFKSGSKARFREKYGLREDDVVIGHVGRLAPEKNLGFLAQAVSQFLYESEQTHFIVVGQGPSESQIKNT